MSHKLELCPCCHTPSPAFHYDAERSLDYFLCTQCGTAFHDPTLRLSGESEKKRYDLHENDITQSGYQNFLKPLLDELRGPWPVHSRALDFGCGPTQSLKNLVVDSNLEWSVYDKFYAEDESVFAHRFDVVAASEVFEHLHDPRFEFQRIAKSLKPGGQLWIMTSLFHPETTAFAQWPYRRDPTHIVFYSPESFRYLAREFGFEEPVFPHARVIGLRKSMAALNLE